MKRGPDGRVSVVPSKPKDGRRTIALPPAAVIALRAHRKRQSEERLAGSHWRDEGLVFPSAVGTPLDPSDVRRTFCASRQEGRDHRRAVPVLATPQRRLAPSRQWRQYRGGGRPAGRRPPHALPPLSAQGPAYRRSRDSYGRPSCRARRPVRHRADKGCLNRANIIFDRGRKRGRHRFSGASRTGPLGKKIPAQNGWA